jgi:hypothetical protein
MKKEFKKGDPVVFKSHNECGGSYTYNGDDIGGKKGTIVEVSDCGKVRIRLHEPIPTHKEIWSMRINEIDHIDSFSPKTKHKINFNY